jgi:hypothetical protein
MADAQRPELSKTHLDLIAKQADAALEVARASAALAEVRAELVREFAGSGVVLRPIIDCW